MYKYTLLSALALVPIMSFSTDDPTEFSGLVADFAVQNDATDKAEVSAINPIPTHGSILALRLFEHKETTDLDPVAEGNQSGNKQYNSDSTTFDTNDEFQKIVLDKDLGVADAIVSEKYGLEVDYVLNKANSVKLQMEFVSTGFKLDMDGLLSNNQTIASDGDIVGTGGLSYVSDTKIQTEYLAKKNTSAAIGTQLIGRRTPVDGNTQAASLSTAVTDGTATEYIAFKSTGQTAEYASFSDADSSQTMKFIVTMLDIG